MVPLKLEQLKEKLGRELAKASSAGQRSVQAPTWFSDALPDAGFPIGITELCSLYGLGGSTFVAAQTIASAQAEVQVHCCWVDPESSLHAPGLMQQGVDLKRLLVVRPERARFKSVAVRIARSGAMAVMVIDFHPVGVRRGAPPKSGMEEERWIRRLQLACEEGGTAVLLLTDERAKGSVLPVALKLRLQLLGPQKMSVTVLKERTGKVGHGAEVALP